MTKVMLKAWESNLHNNVHYVIGYWKMWEMVEEEVVA